MKIMKPRQRSQNMYSMLKFGMAALLMSTVAAISGCSKAEGKYTPLYDAGGPYLNANQAAADAFRDSELRKKMLDKGFLFLQARCKWRGGDQFSILYQYKYSGFNVRSFEQPITKCSITPGSASPKLLVEVFTMQEVGVNGRVVRVYTDERYDYAVIEPLLKAVDEHAQQLGKSL